MMGMQMQMQCESCMNQKPRFLRLLMDEFKDRLWLPPEFNMKTNQIEKAYLTCGGDRVWCVEVRETKEGLVLEEGWRKFVEDNHLQKWEFLLFSYSGQCHFNVSMFGSNFCERKSFATVCEHMKYPVNAVAPSSEECKPKKVTVKRNQLKAWKAASNFKSTNPTFMKKITGRRIYFMRIPRSFLESYLGDQPLTMTLCDPSGRKYAVNYIYLNNPVCGGLSAGWKKFALENNLEGGDVCVFELKKNKEFKVHIFRGQEYGDPSIDFLE